MWKVLMCFLSCFSSDNTPDTRPSCTSQNPASLFDESHHAEVRFIRDVLVDLAYEIQQKLKLPEPNYLCTQLVNISTRSGGCFSQPTEIKKFSGKSASVINKIEAKANEMIEYLEKKSTFHGQISLADQLYYSIIIQKAIDRLVTANCYKEDDKFISKSLFLSLKLSFSPGIKDDATFISWVLDSPEPVIVLFYDPHINVESRQFSEKVETLIYNVEERIRVPLAKVDTAKASVSACAKVQHTPRITVFQNRKELQDYRVSDISEEGKLEKVINTFVALKAEKMRQYHKIK